MVHIIVANTLRWSYDYGSPSSPLSRCCFIAVNLSVVCFFKWFNTQSFIFLSCFPLCFNIGPFTFGGITNGNFALPHMRSDVLWKSLSPPDVTAGFRNHRVICFCRKLSLGIYIGLHYWTPNHHGATCGLSHLGVFFPHRNLEFSPLPIRNGNPPPILTRDSRLRRLIPGGLEQVPRRWG